MWLKHRSAHVCAVSTEVLARAGVLDGQAAVPAGGVIVRDDAGDPTGVLLEAAQALAGDLLRPYGVADLADAIARATAVFAREGLTHVTEAGIAGGWIGRSPRELAAYQLARERGDLAVRVDLMPETSVLHDVPGGPGRGLDLGLRPGLGDLDLRIGPMKIFFDGALSSRTAAMREPYADRDHAGYLGAEPEVLHDALVEAVAGGWTVAAHAIGDRAVDAALDAFADGRRPAPGPACARPGTASSTPGSSTTPRSPGWPPSASRPSRRPGSCTRSATRWPPPSATTAPTCSTATRRSCGPACGCRRARTGRASPTDTPCAGSSRWCSGAPRRDGRWAPTRPSTSSTALRAYTVDAAWIAGDEDVRGRLAPGLAADLVVLGDDLTRVDTDRIGDIEVVATLRGGRATHGAGALGLPPDGDPS